MSSSVGNERVGFIGVGNQGAPIAMRILQAGHPLTVWARRPEALADFRAAGADVATSIADLAASCPMVAICVTTDADVLEVTLAEGGLLPSMTAGSTLAVHSTTHPDIIKRVAAAGAERGIAVLDAPVSGGNAAAEAGTLAVLVGGDPETAERWRPVLATYSASAERLGDIGAGQLAKLVNNALSAISLATAIQALDSAEAQGLDRTAMHRAMLASSGESFMLRQVPHVLANYATRAAPRYRKDLTLYQGVVDPSDSAGQALAAQADAAVALLEGIATPR
jgi:3-hydroxyisobutyrate dehydrogenase